MNFWKLSIIPLLIAAAFILGTARTASDLPHLAERGMEFFDLKAFEPAAPHDIGSVQSMDKDGDDGENPFSNRKRTRKCWRPEQRVAAGILVPAESPADLSLVAVDDFKPAVAAPAPSEMLFMTGGYVRLFQKG